MFFGCNILYNIISYTTENLPVIFWKSAWETFSEDDPKKETMLLPEGETSFSKNKPSTVYFWGGVLGVYGLQNPVIYFPT